MTTTSSGNRTTINVAGTEVEMFTGGSGPPLLFLHGAGGNSGWQRYHEELSANYTVYVPSQPGFNGTERPDWVYTINDVCHFNLQLVQALGLENYILMGSSMGGWVSAEMAAMSDANLRALILVDAAGIKPEQGEIADSFIISPAQINDLIFHDPTQAPEYGQLYGQPPTPEQAEIAEGNREMAVRLCWKPYMYDPRLPDILRMVNIPARVVWGREDRLVPLECGELYQQALPQSDLVVIDNCGHSPQVEKPDEFVRIALEFLA